MAITQIQQRNKVYDYATYKTSIPAAGEFVAVSGSGATDESITEVIGDGVSTVDELLVLKYGNMLTAAQKSYIPTTDEKDALAGAYGTPSASNPYVLKEGMFTDFVDYPSASYTFPSSATPVAFTAGKVPIGAVTTNPTKGTTSEDRAQWAKIGSELKINANYKQSTTGTAGSGTYLIPVPSPYTIDLTKNPVGSVVGYGHVSGLLDEITASSRHLVVRVYSSTMLLLEFESDSAREVVYIPTAYFSTGIQYFSIRLSATISCAQFTPWGYV